MSETTKQIYKDHAIDTSFIIEIGSMSDQAVLDLFIKEVSLGDDTLTKRKRIILAELGDRFRWRTQGFKIIDRWVPTHSAMAYVPVPLEYNPHADTLLDPSPVGRRVKVDNGSRTWDGTIIGQYIHYDDRSSHYWVNPDEGDVRLVDVRADTTTFID
jgi:hypothetical protein